MKKTVLNVVLAIVGFGVMLALWCAGAFCYEYSFENGALVNKYDIVPTIIIFAMPVLLLITAFTGKKFRLKVLYYSALIGVGLPVLSNFLFYVFSDDGNILSWIFGLSLGLFMSPFHYLAFNTFDGVWLGTLGLDSDFCKIILVVGICASVAIYKNTKPKIPENK